MLEHAGNLYLALEMKSGQKYIAERMESGELVFLAPWTGVADQMAAGGDPTPLAEYARRWLDSVKPQVKESSYMKYWNLLYSYIIPELGGTQWGALDRDMIEAFCGRMLASGGKKQKGLSAKTVTDIMSVLRRIFGYASDHGAAETFSISSITVKKEVKEMKCLTRKQQEKLYRYLLLNLTGRNLGLLVCMFAGLRLGEVCALRWEDISFAEQTIYVHRTMQRIQTKDDPSRKTRIVITPPKSGSSVRRIPIPRELIRILYACRKGQSGYILTGTKETFVEPRTMERHFDGILRKLGMEHVNFHALRHTFATRCVEMEFDVKSLSEILGHANVNITLNRYVHPTMELKRRNMQKLSVLMAVG